MGASSDYDRCKLDIESRYAFSYENETRYQEIYNQLISENNSEWEKWLDTPYTADADGQCTVNIESYSFKCSAGQTPRQCMPEQCWEVYKTSDFIIARDAKEQFLDEMVANECGGGTSSTPSTSESTPASSGATTMIVSGRVIDDQGGMPGVSVSVPGMPIYTATDENGNFELEVTSITDNIQIESIGYEPKLVAVAPDVGTITLIPSDTTILDEAIISVGAGEPCTSSDLANVSSHATAGEYRTNSVGGLSCYITQCATNYIADTTNNKCLGAGDKCLTLPQNATSGKYELRNNQLVCKINKCAKGYLPNDDGTACDASQGPCTDTQIAAIEHATAGELKSGVCHATECDSGYEVKDGKCVAISGNCQPMPDNATSAHREWDTTTNTEVCIIDACRDGYSVAPDKKSCITAVLSREDSEKQIAELQENADAMREKEQSLANRLLGAAGMGATGAGLMMTASALAQQNAANSATRDMTAYLATFRCDFGQGRNINGGETNISLPGGNQLLPLYTEYITLAADLKTRKDALGLSPGIESEVIMDSATSGLYDDVSSGRADGAFVSLAAALSDPTGAAAAAWAEQQNATAQQLQTGLITAGAGTVAGIIGNLAINYNKNAARENSDAILAKYAPLKSLENAVALLPNTDRNATCPDGTNGIYPNCVCTDTKYTYNTNTNLCEACPGDRVAINNVCACPDGTIPGENDTCVQIPIISTCQYKCNLADKNITANPDNCTCSCINGFMPEYSETDSQYIESCYCPSDTHTINADGRCITKTAIPTPIIDSLEIPAAQMFALSESQLTPDAQNTIAEFAKNVQQTSGTDANWCITITGHTDKTGTPQINVPLSQQRADAVRNVLVQSGLPADNITARGIADQECTQTGPQQECRKVVIDYSESTCAA